MAHASAASETTATVATEKMSNKASYNCDQCECIKKGAEETQANETHSNEVFHPLCASGRHPDAPGRLGG